MSPRRALLALLSAGLVLAGVGGAHAAFTATTENPGNSIVSATTFPTTITTSAWDINDYANGVNTDRSPIWAFSDGRSYTFTDSHTSENTNRYARYDFGAHMKPGLAVSSAQLNVGYHGTDNSDNACFKANVRQITGDTSLGTSAQQCTAATSTTNVNVAVTTWLNTTDKVNDARIRLNGWFTDSTGGDDWVIDKVNLTITTTQGTVVLYPDGFVDVSDENASNGGAGGMCQSSQTGTGSEGPWGLLTSADSACLYGNANWTTTSYNAGRYIDFVIPASSVPAGATIRKVTLNHAWRPLAANNTCYFVEARQGASAISTHGSSGSPLACSSTTGSNSSQTVVLTGVDTATEVNGLFIRLYYWSAASTMTRHDQLTVAIKYS